jgi:L-aminopeptidase/D-esterase-like protein
MLPDGIVVGAIVVINALGGMVHPMTGELYATSGGFDIPLLYQQPDVEPDADAAGSPTNTTLAVVATNAALSKPQVAKVADLVHDGLARAIRPVHAMLDGDSVFALSTLDNAIEPEGTTGFNLTDMVGHAAADVIVMAVLDAAGETTGVDDWPSVSDAAARITGR